MKLETLWAEYEEEEFNLSVLPSELVAAGQKITFAPRKVIVSRGDFPEYLYFIQSGKALGTRDYADGNEYNYFQIDQDNGNVGLLEILAKKNRYVATIMSLTEVEAIRIDSAMIYDFIMKDPGMLRRCTTLVARDLYRRSGNDGILYYLSGINRLRHYLVHYYEERALDQDRIIVEAEYQDIAKQVGVSVRTVGRSIQKLKRAGEIQSVNKKIVLTGKTYQILFENLWS